MYGNDNQKGYLLLDVFFALMVLSIAMGACFQAFRSAAQWTEHGKWEQRVAKEAEEKWLEVTAGIPFPDYENSELSWNVSLTPETSTRETLCWTATWIEAGKTYEEKFDMAHLL